MPMKFKKTRLVEIADPSDLKRRLQLFEELTTPKGTPSEVPGGSPTDPLRTSPIFTGLPIKLVDYVIVENTPQKSAAQVLELTQGLDLAALTKEHNQFILAIPQAASSIQVGKAQARVLANHKEVEDASLVRADQLWRVLSIHDELQGMVPALFEYVQRVHTLRDVVSTVRTEAQTRARTFLTDQVRTLPGDHPSLPRFRAALSLIEEKERLSQIRKEEERKRASENRDRALSTLTEAQAELQLADVVSQLRTGQVPDREALLSAAKQLAKGTGQKEAAPTVPPLSSPKRPPKGETRARSR